MRLELLDEGTRTRVLRVVAGLSQHDLAARSGIDRRRISEHELGQRTLPPAALERVHGVLRSLNARSGAEAADAVT